MSVSDPLGGGVTTGGVIEVTTGVAVPFEVSVSGSQIVYNGKTVSLTRPPFQVHIDPFLQRTVNVTLTGAVETLRKPRVTVMVRVGFRPSTSASERVSCDNIWQWLQNGNAFRVILDTDKTVSTTITGSEAAGQTLLTVANASGITGGNIYALVGGPYYQLVTVSGVSGSDVTIAQALDFTFPAGSVFRDWLLWDGIIYDSEAHAPIQDQVPVGNINNSNHFDWTLDFVEVVP